MHSEKLGCSRHCCLCSLAPIPPAFLKRLRTIQLGIRCHGSSNLPSAEALALLNIQVPPAIL